MQNLTFQNGDKMPALGLGTWKSKPGEVENAVEHAVKTGYRHIDCAPIYQNEQEAGKGLESGMKKTGVSRDEMWVTSKLWNTEHQQERVIPALKQTLHDLRLDYLDLFLIHWPVALKPGTVFPEKPQDFLSLDEVPLAETWAGMQETVKAGLAKHIGVCNFNISNIKTLQKPDFIPEMNQVEMHPYLPQNKLHEYCTQNNIHVTAYSPLGSPDRPPKIKQENEPLLMRDKTIVQIADERNVHPALILLAWSLQRGNAVIPKSVTPDHIESNLRAGEIKLNRDEMNAINSVENHFRFVDGSFWTPEGSPYSLDFLWK